MQMMPPVESDSLSRISNKTGVAFGMTEGLDSTNSSTCKDAILSILKGTIGEVKLKKLRKQVLISLQLDDSDKAAKKSFKRTAKTLEETGEICISAEGLVALPAQGKKRKSKEEKKSRKKKVKFEVETADAQIQEGVCPQNSSSDSMVDSKHKNKPCQGNPQGCTRLFLGNLPFSIDETSLGLFLNDKATHIKWITDKETGKFYGSAFVEMEDSIAAANAVAKAGESLMGRPVKINFAPARPGDIWPPEKKVITGGAVSTGGQAGGTGRKAMGEKPENCVKLFIGNLSYDIDDDGIKKFFETVGAEVKAVRWLHHKESGDFKGCGFVEFWNTEACDKGATLNGKNVLGRPIRIDWTD